MHDLYYNELRERANALQESAQRVLALTDRDFGGQANVDAFSPLKIAFVGQYSAGKSSLIKMLTGIESIVVGAGVTTTEATTYDYKGLHIVDTPGIRAGHCETHDAIAQRAIDDSDLLVFVITNELFDDVLGAEFRRLCFDLQRQKQLLIVINKSQNDAGTEQAKLAGICAVLDPLIPENFQIVFTDAESYFNALTEGDPREREELLQLSNCSGLVTAIDDFVAKRGLYARITTPLQSVQAALQQKLESLSPATPEEEALRAILRQAKRVFENGRRGLKKIAGGAIEEAHGKIVRQGGVLADAVGGDASEFDRVQSAANAECKRIVENALDSLEQTFDRAATDLESELAQLANTPLGKRVMEMLRAAQDEDASKAPKSNAQHRHPGDRSALNVPLAKGVVEHAKSGFAFLAKSAVGDASKEGLRQVSGSTLHEAVKKVGEFAGYKFKAWEAVKIADCIGKGAKFLGPALAVAGLGLQYLSDTQAARDAARLLETKREVRKGFLKLADEVRAFLTSTTTDRYLVAYDGPIAEIEAALEGIRKEQETQTAYSQELAGELAAINRFVQQVARELP